MNQTYIIRCTSCGTKNRVPTDKAGQTGKCGKCGSSFETDALLAIRPVTVISNNFEATVLNSQLPMLLDFWAAWCGPCQMIGTALEQIASEYKGRLKVGKLNIDQSQDIAARYDVMSVPTLMLFDRGQVKGSLFGAVPKNQIVQMITPHLY